MAWVSYRDLCPKCGSVIPFPSDHTENIQFTKCPSGDPVWREWGGPENIGWDRAVSPYGWSKWHTDKRELTS